MSFKQTKIKTEMLEKMENKRKYDVIIIGASTTGSWFGNEMAKRGFKVLMLEKQERENVSRNYDIFHMAKSEMEKFGYPIPEKGDEDYSFEFDGGSYFSAYGNYPKPTHNIVIGMRKHRYILRLNDNAVKAGAELIYGASFSGFVFDEQGRIAGAKYKTADGEQEALGAIVADCSGIPSVARRALPDGLNAENFEITPRDMFYVILYYVLYPEGHEKVIHTDSFLQYKVWSAPQDDEKGGILGVGANLSFEYAEEMFRQFRKNVPWSTYTVQKIERGRTPYRRPPYSFVADGFIAMGDAACLTKPNNGEGCTSSLYQAEIAVDVISNALREGGYLTEERLWSINKRYIDVQGKAFAGSMALLTGAVALNCEENEYFFKNDIIFSKSIMAGFAKGISITPKEAERTIRLLAAGVAAGKIRVELIRRVLAAFKNSVEMKALYSEFPETPEGFDIWRGKANELWERVGSMADSCDEEIIDRMKRRAEGKIKTVRTED